MPPPLSDILRPERALIFRITHINNVPWILRNGLRCRNSSQLDPDFHTIGDEELIAKRHAWTVPIDPHGTLADYISFYFTPSSIMLFRVTAGDGRLPKSQVAIIVANLQEIHEAGITFLFTDRHANANNVSYFRDLNRLDQVPWGLLQARDFKEDPKNPSKKQYYQAEAFVHRHLPTAAIAAIGCYSDDEKTTLEQYRSEAGMETPRIVVRPHWYF